VAIPSFALGAPATGSSCCDELAAGMANGVYTVVLTVGSIAPNASIPAERVVPFDFATNQQMYNAANAHINFINTGTINYTVDVEGTATVTTYNGASPAASVQLMLRYNGVLDQTYPVQLHQIDNDPTRGLGYSENFTTSITIDQTTNYPPQFLLRSPHFAEIIVERLGDISTWNVTYTNTRVTIRGSP
jgi:hypothetical protein